ncbi:hypothetical protein V4V35_23870 [Bacillus infantis]|uniref:hypothetical protein n=1 Tax=Bacillus infantis TaxID=324767 RepID=UPI002FBE5116
MVTVQTDNRVYVETPLFSGWGAVQYEDPNESFYEMQICLDVADSDGHRIKRVSKFDIKDPAIEEPTTVPFETPDTRLVGTSLIQTLFIKKGMQYLLAPTKANAGTHCNLYDLTTKRYMGCQKLNDFKELSPYIGTAKSELIIDPAPLEESSEVPIIVANKKGQLGFEF